MLTRRMQQVTGLTGMRMISNEVRETLRETHVDKATFSRLPMQQFVKWFKDACKAEVYMPDSMNLATASICPETKRIQPTSRQVLVKDVLVDGHLLPVSHWIQGEEKQMELEGKTYFTPEWIAQTTTLTGQDHLGVENGFIFCTNYDSRKGHQIEENNLVALYFLWDELERAVRIEGPICKIPSLLSDRYHNERPRDSRISACASKQSQVIDDPNMLLTEIQRLESEFAASADPSVIPRPKNWGGYIIIPHRIEFWQGRKSRRHERLLYELKKGSIDGSADNWTKEYLQP